MAHFADQYADRFNELLHSGLFAHYFYKQIIEIPGLLTAILVTYDGVPDDRREIHDNMSREGFLTRMSVVEGDWIHFERRHMEGLRDQPQKTIGGWEGRAIYFIKGGQQC